MEKELNFESPFVEELDREKLSEIAGGMIGLFILQLYLHRREINDFCQGFVDGFTENKT